VTLAGRMYVVIGEDEAAPKDGAALVRISSHEVADGKAVGDVVGAGAQEIEIALIGSN
jgi:hypothetical protein